MGVDSGATPVQRRRVRHAAPCAAAILCLAWGVGGSGAADSGDETIAARPETVDEQERTASERIIVTAPRPEVGTEILGREELDSGRAANLALAAAAVPGVWGVRRAQGSLEPVIRGLGWERVQTQINGLPLYGACAARMDPPATLVSPAPAQEVSVVKGLASVTLGPGGTGGRLVVSTDYERADARASETLPWARLSYDGSRAGPLGAAGVRGGSGRIDYAAGLQALQADDYTSPGGVLVPAGERASGGFASFGLHTGRSQRLSFGAVLRTTEDTDFPSLPMDSDRERARLYSAAWRYRPTGGDGRLAWIQARAGYAPIDHQMSNRRKTTWATQQATSRSSSDTLSAGASAAWTLGSGVSLLTAGADFTAVDRDAVRSRTMTMTGMTSVDHLWPEVSQDDLGLFLEFSPALARGWRVRAGLRADRVASAAGAADDPGLGGLTVRENYVQLYGPASGRTDRTERLFSGNVLIGRDLSARITVEGGFGVASRPAGVTERFFSYAPAPGGYLVGDPALDAESKREASVGVVIRGRAALATVTVFRYAFTDYIAGLVLARQDGNGDGVLDTVRGFENVRALFVGGEAALVVQPGRRLKLPMSVSYVRAGNRDSGRPLAEIPPLEGRVAARFGFRSGDASWVELGACLVARQTRIDAAYGENATPGYAVWHLRGQWAVGRIARLQAGIENLLDKDYHEHLTREAAVPAGGLAQGDEIPQPGRALVVSLGADF
jgi:iron complex outermembrane receptor protein